MLRQATGLTILIVSLLAGFTAYQYFHTRITAELYRQRLIDLSQSYESLRHTYNQAVKKTAVTELLVQDGRLSVVVRAADGVQRVIHTPLDPSGEVYADYVLIDSRLWIRRLFDERTAPTGAVIIDPLVERIDWDSPRVAHGKAVYRRLDEGRWVVTVTGDGSLGLAKAKSTDAVDLIATPSVQDYPQIQRELSQRIDQITAIDIFKRVFAIGG